MEKRKRGKWIHVLLVSLIKINLITVTYKPLSKLLIPSGIFFSLLLFSGFVDVFSDNKEAVVNHGHKLLRVSCYCTGLLYMNTGSKLNLLVPVLINHGRYV